MIIIKILLIFIFYIIILLLGILLIIIISPIKGSINTSNNYLELKYQYLFGLLKFNYLKINKTKKINIKILFFNIKSNKKENSNKSNNNNNSKKKSKFIIPNKTVVIHILHTLKKIIIKISPNNAYGHFIIGLDDPYYTVIIQMISQIIFTPLNTLKNYNFTLETDFLELRFKYDIRLAIDFSIIQLVIPLISLILKKPIREYFKKIKRT